jgi:hypothetical protein
VFGIRWCWFVSDGYCIREVKYKIVKERGMVRTKKAVARARHAG